MPTCRAGKAGTHSRRSRRRPPISPHESSPGLQTGGNRGNAPQNPRLRSPSFAVLPVDHRMFAIQTLGRAGPGPLLSTRSGWLAVKTVMQNRVCVFIACSYDGGKLQFSTLCPGHGCPSVCLSACPPSRRRVVAGCLPTSTHPPTHPHTHTHTLYVHSNLRVYWRGAVDELIPIPIHSPMCDKGLVWFGLTWPSAGYPPPFSKAVSRNLVFRSHGRRSTSSNRSGP